MEVVCKSFRDSQMFVPQVPVSAMAMERTMNVVKPFSFADTVKSKRKVLIRNVKGNIHDMEKNTIATMMQGAGYKAINCGTGWAVNKFYNEH